MPSANECGMMERAKGEASAQGERRNPLTVSEREILGLLAGGRNASEVARLTQRSVHTVRTHIRNAAWKLEARGRRELLARAEQYGVRAARTPPRLQP
jgi:DNA-binding CsgD family transcriptional regulator